MTLTPLPGAETTSSVPPHIMQEREQSVLYDPRHDALIREACMEYCLAKPTVRRTQSGRDRFHRALNLMMAVSLNDDPEVEDCFARINAARGFADLRTDQDAKARDLDNYLTPEQFGFGLRHAQREAERVMAQRGKAGEDARTAFMAEMNDMAESAVESGENRVSRELSAVRPEKTRLSAKELVDRMQEKHDAALASYRGRAERSGEDDLPALTARDAAARYMLAGRITMLLYGRDAAADVGRVARLTNEVWTEYELDYRVPDAPLETSAQRNALMKDLGELSRTWLENRKLIPTQPERAAEPEKNAVRESGKRLP